MDIRRYILAIALSAACLGPREGWAVNEGTAECQMAGSYLVESGVKKLLNLDVLDWVTGYFSSLDPKSRRAKQIKKAIAYIVTGSVMVSLCPPIVVPEGYSSWSEDAREAWAIDHRWDPVDISQMNFDVEMPESPTSCTRQVEVELDSQGRFVDSGDFEKLEFVYAQPFGSFPGVFGHLDEASERLARLILQYVNGLELSIEPISDAIPNVDDLIDESLGEIPSFSLIDVIPGIDDLVLDILNDIDLEDKFRDLFDQWRTDLPQLDSQGVIASVDGGYDFFDGQTNVFIDADINTGIPARIVYNQEVFIKEYFKPEFTIIGTEPNPDTPEETFNIVSSMRFEALEPPGRTDRSYTPPTTSTGSLEAFDNCDNDPKEKFFIPQKIDIGTHYYPIRATDRARNESDIYYIKIVVEDTRPPEVAPPPAIGIEVGLGQVSTAFDEVGCVAYLCQNNDATAQVFPPLFFDFSSASPSYACLVNNSENTSVPCDMASLPTGETSVITWIASDGSGNSSEFEQRVHMREAGSNETPVIENQSFSVSAGSTVSLPIPASDLENDAIYFDMIGSPTYGTLGTALDPAFQTRFALNGTIERIGGVFRYTATSSQVERWIVSDIGNRRLLEVNQQGELTGGRFLNYQPHTLTYDRGEYREFGTSFNQVAADLVAADWESNLVYGLGNDNDVWDAFAVDVSAFVQNPRHISYRADSALSPYHYLVIADQNSNDPTLGRLVILRVDQNTGVLDSGFVENRTLGFNPDGISFDAGFGGQNRYIISDWAGQRAVQWEAELTGSSDGSHIRSWDLAFMFGAGISGRIGDPEDIVVDEQGAGLQAFVADNRDRELDVVFLRFDQSTNDQASSSADTELASRFSEIQGLVELPDGEEEFVVLEEGRLATYDIFGVLDGLIPVQSIDGSNLNPLTPSASDAWTDIDVHASGDILMVEEGSGANLWEIKRVSFAPGFGQYTEVENALFDPGQYGQPRAMNYYDAPGTAEIDDRIYILSRQGLLRLEGNLGNPTHLLEPQSGGCAGAWCVPDLDDDNIFDELADVVVGPDGMVFVSETEFHRIHAWAADGMYQGWKGRCDSGSNCDPTLGTSFGFSCTQSTCSVVTSRGNGPGHFDFEGNCAQNELVGQRKCYGRLDVDAQNGRLFVTDYPVLDTVDYSTVSDVNCSAPGGASISSPRVQVFSLSGLYLTQSVPNAVSGNLLSFLEAGDFTGISDIAIGDERIYVAEGRPLQRVHAIDIEDFEVTLSGANLEYIAPGSGGVNDVLTFQGSDAFGMGEPATLNLNIVDDVTPPLLSCPDDIEVEANTIGGARAADGTDPESGNPALASFLLGYSVSDDVDFPLPEVSDDAPDVFLLGQTEVNFSATDGAGLQTSCTATVTVADNTPPDFSLTEEVVEVPATGSLTAFSLSPPEVIDAEGTAVLTSDAPGEFPLGETVVTWVAVDSSGNRASVSQRVVVIDEDAPTAIGPSDVEIQEAVNGYANALEYSLPVMSDVLPSPNGVICSPRQGALLPSERVDIVCTAADLEANILNFEFAVEIKQFDGDDDGISDLVDPEVDTPGLRFDDQAQGNSAYGAILAGAVQVEDAYVEPAGLRLSTRWTLGEAEPGIDGMAEACEEKIQIEGLGLFSDEDGARLPEAIRVTCAPSRFLSLSGEQTLVFPHLGEGLALDLPAGQEVQVAADGIEANSQNDVILKFKGPQDEIELAPGEALTRAQLDELRAAAPNENTGCSCRSNDPGALVWLSLLVILLRFTGRRRRSSRFLM